jgi:hypothetical protein
MEAENYLLTLFTLTERKYGMPLYEKLGMSRDQCRAWLMALHEKSLSLSDAQETIETVVARRGEAGDQENLDELLHYV